MLFLRNLARIVCVALLLAISLPVGLANAAPAQAAVTWTVLVGGEGIVTQTADGPRPSWELMRFYPDSITINEGDTIDFKLNSIEFHTVSFLKPGDTAPDIFAPEGGNSQRLLFNPLAAMPQGGASYDGTTFTSSGQLGGSPQAPKDYKLTFTKAGTFAYLCLVHPMMKGKVIVQAAGSAYPKTQAQIDAEAKDMLAQDVAAATKVQPSIQSAADRPGANGTTIHQIKLGYGEEMMNYMRFTPGNLTIHAGDSVEFVQNDPEAPHTVTFASGAAEPDLVLPEPQPNGPPKLVLNPQVIAPAGGPVYSGKGFFNSGLIFGIKAPQPGPRSYTLSFDTPGSYEYICILHDSMGMSGMITVVPQGAALTSPSNPAPAPANPAALPKAGSGPDFGQTIVGLLLSAVALMLSGVAVGRLYLRAR